MADEATIDSGSLEAAAASLKEAREAPQEKQPEPADTAQAATDDAQPDSPPDQPEAAEVDPQPEPEAEQTTFDGPRWLTAEERALYAALPPEQQQAVQRLANSTKAAESRRQNEHQAAVKAAQEAAEQAAQERQYLQSTIQHYKHPVENAFRQQFADVIAGQTDLFRLAQDQQRWPIYQAFQAEFQRIGMAETQLAQRAEAEEQSRLSQHIEARNNRLLEARPDLKDQAKFEQFDAEVTNYLRGYNVPDERIARVSYEELEIAEKAMLWDKAQKAKAAAPKAPQPKPGQIPVTGHVRTLPGRVLKPGSPNSGGALDDKIAAITQRARQSGSTEDAAERLRLARERITRRA